MVTTWVKAVPSLASLSKHWLLNAFKGRKLFEMIAKITTMSTSTGAWWRPITRLLLFLSKVNEVCVEILSTHTFSVDRQVIATVAMNYNQSEACFLFFHQLLCSVMALANVWYHFFCVRLIWFCDSIILDHFFYATTVFICRFKYFTLDILHRVSFKAHFCSLKCSFTHWMLMGSF